MILRVAPVARCPSQLRPLIRAFAIQFIPQAREMGEVIGWAGRHVPSSYCSACRRNQPRYPAKKRTRLEAAILLTPKCVWVDVGKRLKGISQSSFGAVSQINLAFAESSQTYSFIIAYRYSHSPPVALLLFCLPSVFANEVSEKTNNVVWCRDLTV